MLLLLLLGVVVGVVAVDRADAVAVEGCYSANTMDNVATCSVGSEYKGGVFCPVESGTGVNANTVRVGGGGCCCHITVYHLYNLVHGHKTGSNYQGVEECRREKEGSPTGRKLQHQKQQPTRSMNAHAYDKSERN